MSRSLGWAHPGLEREVLTADVHRGEARLDSAMAGIWKNAPGVSTMAMSRVWPTAHPSIFQSCNELIDAVDVLGALRLSDRDAVHISSME